MWLIINGVHYVPSFKTFIRYQTKKLSIRKKCITTLARVFVLRELYAEGPKTANA
jgi:hypothetical protein